MGKAKDFNDIITFDQHYNRFILPLLNEVEKERKKALSTCLPLYGIGIFIFIFYFLVDTHIIPQSVPKAFYVIKDFLCMLATFILIIGLYVQNNYKTKTKEKLFNILFSFLGNFKYEKDASYADNNFERIDFFPYFDRSSIDDYITGTYKNLNIEFKEMCLSQKRRERKGRTRYVQVFSGLLITVPQLKTTNARITIKNRAYREAVNKNAEVILEDVNFNKLYKVSATDQIEARYILTPTFIEKLKNLHNKKIHVVISIQDGDIIMAMQKNTNLFEPPFWTSAKNINAYKEIISQLSEALKIIDTLQLNIKPKL